ncbi:MAG: hypothetical protein PCFJNLEI_00321 [Verrucomicrobiae bacterium]|nr:hypothetical protein [Verrucomicrobiae bacterium]
MHACENCGTKFQPKRRTRRFCNAACRSEARHKKVAIALRPVLSVRTLPVPSGEAPRPSGRQSRKPIQPRKLHVLNPCAAYRPVRAWLSRVGRVPGHWQDRRADLLGIACAMTLALIEQTGCTMAAAFNSLRPSLDGIKLGTARRPLRLSSITFWRVYSRWLQTGGQPKAFRLHFDRCGRKPNAIRGKSG